MFLTKIVFNKQLRGARNLLSNPQKLHAAIMYSFDENIKLDDNLGRPLYRLESTSRDPVLYLSSPVVPDVKHIIEQAGRENDKGNSYMIKSLDNFLGNIQIGETYKFRMTANPTKNINNNHVPLIKENRVEWLERKGSQHGFELVSTPEVTYDKKVSFYHNPRKITFSHCTFNGYISVVDKDLLIQSLKNGIGRQKAYGMGLLSLGRTPNES